MHTIILSGKLKYWGLCSQEWICVEQPMDLTRQGPDLFFLFFRQKTLKRKITEFTPMTAIQVGADHGIRKVKKPTFIAVVLLLNCLVQPTTPTVYVSTFDRLATSIVQGREY